MRVAWFPKTLDLAGNPYWELLQTHLEQEGIIFEDSHSSYWMERRWLLRNRSFVDVLHFHFIQPQYAGSNSILLLRRLMKFTSNLLLARALGYHLIWTLHDLMPTWPSKPPWIDLLARLVMARAAHQVIVHCEEARHLLTKRFHRSHGVWITPHPGFPVTMMARAEARTRLGLGDHGIVIMFAGGIRPNKGIEQLIAAFCQVAPSEAALVIAGKPWQPQEYVDSIRRLTETDYRIRLDAKPIPHEDLQVYVRAASVVVLPFREILTSSSVALAMSCGRPVIVPRVGCPPEVIDADAGIVYNPDDPSALSRALQQALSSDLDAMGSLAAKRVSSYTWRDMARSTAQAYRQEKIDGYRVQPQVGNLPR